MRKITPEQLDEILKKHLAWINDEPGGEKANLSYANLRDADLRSANLSDANLSYANLSYANLRDADLSYANLRYADLSYANLRYANLRSASIGGGAEGQITPETFGLTARDPDLPRRVAEAALKSNDALSMSSWHTCETTHCLAGWAVHLSGVAGYALEKATSPSAAGAMLMPSAAHLFYADNETAREWLTKQLPKAIDKPQAGAATGNG